MRKAWHFAHRSDHSGTDCSGGGSETLIHHTCKTWIAEHITELSVVRPCVRCDTPLTVWTPHPLVTARNEVRVDGTTRVADVMVFAANVQTAVVEVMQTHACSTEKLRDLDAALSNVFEITAFTPGEGRQLTCIRRVNTCEACLREVERVEHEAEHEAERVRCERQQQALEAERKRQQARAVERIQRDQALEAERKRQQAREVERIQRDQALEAERKQAREVARERQEARDPDRVATFARLGYSCEGERALDPNIAKTFKFVREHYIIPSDFESSSEFGPLSGTCYESRVITAYMCGQLHRIDGVDKLADSPFPTTRYPDDDMKMCRMCGSMGHFPRYCPDGF